MTSQKTTRSFLVSEQSGLADQVEFLTEFAIKRHVVHHGPSTSIVTLEFDQDTLLKLIEKGLITNDPPFSTP